MKGEKSVCEAKSQVDRGRLSADKNSERPRAWPWWSLSGRFEGFCEFQKKVRLNSKWLHIEWAGGYRQDRVHGDHPPRQRKTRRMKARVVLKPGAEVRVGDHHYRIDQVLDLETVLVQFQTFLLSAMRRGKGQLWGFNEIQGAPFLSDLYQRMQFFLFKIHAPGFQEAFGAYLHPSFFESHLTSRRHRSIEGLGVEDRLIFMLFISWWFNRQCER